MCYSSMLVNKLVSSVLNRVTVSTRLKIYYNILNKLLVPRRYLEQKVETLGKINLNKQILLTMIPQM